MESTVKRTRPETEVINNKKIMNRNRIDCFFLLDSTIDCACWTTSSWTANASSSNIKLIICSMNYFHFIGNNNTNSRASRNK